jgi:hypothetical protein
MEGIGPPQDADWTISWMYSCDRPLLAKCYDGYEC